MNNQFSSKSGRRNGKNRPTTTYSIRSRNMSARPPAAMSQLHSAVRALASTMIKRHSAAMYVFATSPVADPLAMPVSMADSASLSIGAAIVGWTCRKLSHTDAASSSSFGVRSSPPIKKFPTAEHAAAPCTCNQREIYQSSACIYTADSIKHVPA